jgi:hypothetical protein
MKMKKQIVRFVVDEELDIENHLIGLWQYKNKFHALAPGQKEKYKKLSKLSLTAQKRFLRNELAWRYAPSKKKMLEVLAEDMNVAWAKIENKFIKGIEKIHERPFAFKHIRGVLSSDNRFGYSLKDRWFSVSMFRNTFAGGTDNAMHELMHFMFLTYYLKPCQDRGLSEKQIWDIKESFTTLLNVEFDDLRFNWDAGYPEHKELRAATKEAWLKTRDFDATLEQAILFVKEKRK